MIEILIIFFAIVVAGLLAFMIYRAVRTYDAGAHATFITTRNGDFYGALRSPMTIWDPSIKVLRDRRAPEITIMTVDPAGNYYEKSLVTRRTGEISLRVHTCAPRPFVTRTADKRSLIIKAKVSFQLDIDRIQIPIQQIDPLSIYVEPRPTVVQPPPRPRLDHLPGKPKRPNRRRVDLPAIVQAEVPIALRPRFAACPRPTQTHRHHTGNFHKSSG